MTAPTIRFRTSIVRRIRDSLGSDAAFLFGGQMLGNVGAYVFHMLMARAMTPADYGVMVTLTSISYVLTVIVRSSQAWVIKTITAIRDVGAGLIGDVFVRVLRASLLLGGVILAVVWLISGRLAEFLHLDSTVPVIIVGLFACTSSLIAIPKGVLLGLGRLRVAGLLYILNPVLRTVAGFVLVAWGFGVNGGLAAYAVGDIIMFSIALIPLWGLLRQKQSGAADLVQKNGLEGYPLLVLAINSCLMIMSIADQVSVKHFFPAEVAGHFAVAFLLGRVITLSTMALSWVVFSRSAVMPPGDPGRPRLLMKAMLVISALAMTLTAGYVALPAFAVRVMGGSQYEDAGAFVGLVGIEMMLFALVYLQVYYQISLKKMQVVWPLCVATVAAIGLVVHYHATVQQILLNLIFVMAGLLIWVSALTWYSFMVIPRRPPWSSGGIKQWRDG